MELQNVDFAGYLVVFIAPDPRLTSNRFRAQFSESTIWISVDHGCEIIVP